MSCKASDIEESLLSLLSEQLSDITSGSDTATDVVTFEDSGLMTRDRGLVLTMSDGDEFQVTIVKSKS